MIINRILQVIIILCVVGIIGIVFYSGALSARQAVFREDYKLGSDRVLSFADPQTERVFYGELSKNGGPVDFFSFNVTKGAELHFQLNVPRLSGLENYRPSLALFGPGLPQPPDSERQSLPFTLPTNMGLVLSQDDPKDLSPRSQVDEPYTITGYWEGQSIGRAFSQDGTYYLAIFSPNDKSGKYTLQVGDQPEIGFKEIIGFPILWLHLRFWFSQELWVILIGAVAVIAIGVWIYFKMLKPLRSMVKSGTPLPATSESSQAGAEQ